MSLLNPFEHLTPLPGKLNLQARLVLALFTFLAAGPAACAALIFRWMPDGLEAMSLRASGLLDVIELGRGRPWVVFTGLPWPATLRLLGDASGVAAVLLVLLVAVILIPFFLKGEWKKKFRNPDYLNLYKKLFKENWYVLIGGFLFFTSLFLYQVVVNFILTAPVRVTSSQNLAMHVFWASSSPLNALVFIVLYGMYFRALFYRI